MRLPAGLNYGLSTPSKKPYTGNEAILLIVTSFTSLLPGLASNKESKNQQRKQLSGGRLPSLSYPPADCVQPLSLGS